MVIEINIHSLIERGLTANQFTILKLMFEGKKSLIKDWLSTEDVKHLIETEYLIDSEKVNESKCRELFELKQSNFWSLFSLYPMKVPGRNGGTRALRAASPDSKDAELCRKRYEKVVKSREAHDYIMKCLDAELAMRRKTNTMQYMQELNVWLNQRSWEKHAYLLEQPSTNNSNIRHGEQFI